MARECVLLIHGLGESEFRMLPLSLALSHMGYRTVGITYPSTHYPAEQLAEEYIAPVLNDLGKEETLHIVTHSMVAYCCVPACKSAPSET